MKIKIVTLLTILFGTFISADELKVRGAQYGNGKHLYRSVNEIEKDVVGLVVSELSKEDFTYHVTTAEQSRLIISRDSIHKSGKTEDLFEFNKNFGSVSASHVEDAWIVDVFAEEHQISFLMAVYDGYVYIKIADDLSKYNKDGLILPPSGVGKGSWNVIQRTYTKTKFGVFFPSSSHGDKIKQIKLNRHDVVNIQFVGETEISVFDVSGDFMKKDGVKLEREKLYNPSVLNAADFFRDISGKLPPVEEEHLKIWVKQVQGGKKKVIEQIKRFSDDPRSKVALSVIERSCPGD